MKALGRVQLPSSQPALVREGFGVSVFVGHGYRPSDYVQVSELEAGSASAVESQISKAWCLQKSCSQERRAGAPEERSGAGAAAPISVMYLYTKASG